MSSNLVVNLNRKEITSLTVESGTGDFRIEFGRVALENLPAILQIFSDQYEQYEKALQTHKDSLPKREPRGAMPL